MTQVMRGVDLLQNGQAQMGNLDDDEMITIIDKHHSTCDWCDCENGPSDKEYSTDNPKYEGEVYCSQYCMEITREFEKTNGGSMSEEIISRDTTDRFFLTGKIVSKKFSYREHQSRGKEWNEVADAVILIPQQTTEADIFLSAWLPEKLTEAEKIVNPEIKEYSEVLFEAGYPVNGYFRGALCHGNHLLPYPHIFVMTKGAEERLRPHAGNMVKLTALGDQEEELLYEAKAETKSPYSNIP